MPQTVPNRPMKGAVEPTEARNIIQRSIAVHLALERHLHDPVDALPQAGAHGSGPADRGRPRAATPPSRRRTPPPSGRRGFGAVAGRRARPGCRRTRTAPRSRRPGGCRRQRGSTSRTRSPSTRRAPATSSEDHDLDDDVGLQEQAPAATGRRRAGGLPQSSALVLTDRRLHALPLSYPLSPAAGAAPRSAGPAARPVRRRPISDADCADRHRPLAQDILAQRHGGRRRARRPG